MANHSITKRAFHQLQQELLQILCVGENEIAFSSRFDTFIPAQDRRRVWEQLREAEFDLPKPTLSSRVFFLAALIVLAPVALLMFFFSWSFLFSLAELTLLARKITSPWAIHPPIGCETMQEAAMRLTPFRHEDYKAGLWPPEDIAAKTRLIIAHALGRPFQTITDDTRLCDLC